MENFDSLIESYIGSFSRMHREAIPRDTSSLPRMEDIERLEETLLSLFFPGHQMTEAPGSLMEAVSRNFRAAMELLTSAIAKAVRYENPEMSIAESLEEAAEITVRLHGAGTYCC